MKRHLLTLVIALLGAAGAAAQSQRPATAQTYPWILATQEELDPEDMLDIEPADTIPEWCIDRRIHATVTAFDMRPAVFASYYMGEPLNLHTSTGAEEWPWLDDELFNQKLMRDVRQGYMISNPDLVRYNQATLPEAPRFYRLTVDPRLARLSFEEDALQKPVELGLPDAPEIRKRHWIHSGESGLQFSQAYISPNWYQGGSNNLTMMLNLAWGVKLNTNYHPNAMAEMGVSYKLHVYGTPEDSLRNYNISEDIFQFTGKVGFKAWRKWYYTVSGQFKTQFFKNYEVNKHDLKAALLSPGELNLGVGMTYSETAAGGRFKLDASIAPLSYNLKTCINDGIDPSSYGITAPAHSVSEYGSSATITSTWQLCSNISLASRLFMFTDYTYAQGDWENTFTFTINRFLSAQFYFHLRYDSLTPRPEEGSKWHKWQVKEVLSLGFAYTFATNS